jgi:hypothetical protein
VPTSAATWEHGRVRSIHGATKASVVAEEIDAVGIRNGYDTVVMPDSTRLQMPESPIFGVGN